MESSGQHIRSQNKTLVLVSVTCYGLFVRLDTGFWNMSHGHKHRLFFCSRCPLVLVCLFAFVGVYASSCVALCFVLRLVARFFLLSVSFQVMGCGLLRSAQTHEHTQLLLRREMEWLGKLQAECVDNIPYMYWDDVLSALGDCKTGKDARRMWFQRKCGEAHRSRSRSC